MGHRGAGGARRRAGRRLPPPGRHRPGRPRRARALEPLAALLRRVGALAGDPLQHRVVARATARATPADLVYVNGATPPTAALLRALDPAPDVPVVLHVHELDVGLRGSLDEADRRLLLDRAQHVIAVSEAVAALLRTGHGVAPERITVCEGFVDVAAIAPRPRAEVRAELGIAADAAVVGSVGLPDWRKDPEHLLRAVARLDDPQVEVLWVGGDPASTDGRHLRDEAARLGLGARVHHVAHRADVAGLLGAFDVFALPAREDALPLAALEAGAAGLPLACFRTGGIAALCDAGAGIAVDYPDTDAFARALAELLRDGAGAGARARALVREHHDVGVGVDRIDAVLCQVLAGT
ncbi:MAG: glycosyltransferase family 4 protein [Acidimicrobiales bacterium]